MSGRRDQGARSPGRGREGRSRPWLATGLPKALFSRISCVAMRKIRATQLVRFCWLAALLKSAFQGLVGIEDAEKRAIVSW